MEQTHIKNDPENSNLINDLDFDLDNLSFSALDKGLGFHHKERSLKESKNSTTYELKNKKLRTANSIKEVGVPSLKNDRPLGLSNEISLEDAFAGTLNENNLGNEHTAPEDVEIEARLIESSLEKVSAAWAVDLLLILISICAALVLFMSATGISMLEFKSFVMLKESQIFISFFFVAFYLLYFSILDINSTPGKLIFGTKLISSTNDRLTVFSTFTRALVILLSFPLFMLPLVFGWHNKLSKTISVEEKW